MENRKHSGQVQSRFVIFTFLVVNLIKILGKDEGHRPKTNSLHAPEFYPESL
jgi:hypothetical protein